MFYPVFKQAEKSGVIGATYFALAAFFSFFFGSDVAIPVLLFHAVGDPAAALAGRYVPIRVCGASLQLARQPMSHPGFLRGWLSAVFRRGWTLGVLAALATAALIEAVPSPVHDNLTAPLIAGLALYLLSSLPPLTLPKPLPDVLHRLFQK